MGRRALHLAARAMGSIYITDTKGTCSSAYVMLLSAL